jgi:NADPH:quinone reductase-like Zn-dependent oxidoreductase
MKAAVVHEFSKPLVIEEVPKPVAGSGEVVVRIETSGLCHTDIHAAHGDWPVKPKPRSSLATRVWGLSRASGPGDRRRGGRPGRRAMARIRLRYVLVLHHRRALGTELPTPPSLSAAAATHRLLTGQIVTVDGTAGTVTLHAAP